MSSILSPGNPHNKRELPFIKQLPRTGIAYPEQFQVIPFVLVIYRSTVLPKDVVVFFRDPKPEDVSLTRASRM